MQEISNLRQELVRLKAFEPEEANIPLEIAHCNTLPNTATIYNALQHTPDEGNVPLEIAPCNTLPNTATIYNALQHTPDEGNVPLEIVCAFLRRAAHSGVSAGR